MNSIALTAAFLAAYKIFCLRNFIDSLVLWFVLYFAQIVLTELILGIFGALYLHNLIILNAAILIFVWLAAKKKKVSFSLPQKDLFSEFLTDKPARFGLAVLAGFFLAKTLINLWNPPFGWDSLNYHFTFPVEWLKNGNLDMPITVSDDPSPPYYPINGSLFYLWHIFPFRNVFIADLGQVPFFILSLLCVYAICRKIELERKISFLAALLFLLIPNFFKQLEVAYVDVMVAGLFLATVNCLFLLNKEFSVKNCVFYGLALGLLIGTKTVALPYAVLLFVPFLYFVFRNIKRANLLFLALFLIIVFGGFTYIRNFIQAGNPLYPLDLKIMGRVIFKGVEDRAMYVAHLRPGDYSLGKMLFHEGLGIQSLFFILPGMFLVLALAFLKKRKDLNFNFIYFLLLPALVYLVYRFIIPLANVRYLYPLLGIGIILGFYSVKLVNIPEKALKIIAVICFLASASEIASHGELIAALVLSAGLFFLRSKKIRLSMPAAAALIFIFAAAFGALNRDYEKNEFARYIKMEEYSGFWPDATRAWKWLNDNTSGNNIAYIGRPVPFPLYGSNFKNNVFYVSVNKTEPAKLHYFSGSHYSWGYDFLSLHRNLEEKGNYRSAADYYDWISNLFHRRIDYLFIYSLHQTKDIEFPLEDNWAKANPDIFRPVFTNETIHVYKTLKLK